MKCIFCEISTKKIPTDIVYETEKLIAIKDISPQAPTHILLLPKIHVQDILELEETEPTLMTEVLKSIKAIVKLMNLEDNGFRVVVNTGKDGGQTVGHLHFHILGGRSLTWPPG